MKTSRLTAITATLVTSFLTAAPFALCATPQPVEWVLSATSRGGVPLKEGATVNTRVLATIQSGWHLYALNQAAGGPAATRISIPPEQPVVMAGDIDQSTPMTGIDPNFNLETHFFEDHATFTVPLKVTAPSPKEPFKVSIDVLYQTCNDTMCLPPAVAHLSSQVKHRN